MKYPIVISLVGIFFLVELSVGVYSKSVALRSDALHMLGDLLALTIGYTSKRLSKKEKSKQYSYGWARAEILGGLINSVFLLSIAFSLSIEVIEKIIDGPQPELKERIMWVLIVGSLGFVVNVIGALIFGHDHHHSSERGSVNDYAVFLHIIGDTLGSIAVIISSLLIMFVDDSNVFYADPCVSVLIIIFIVISSVKLLKKTAVILLHKSHHEIDHTSLEEQILSVDGVEGIHEFHVWSLSQNINVCSLHLTVTKDPMKEVKEILHRHNIHSSTVQLDGGGYCNDLICGDDCINKKCCN